MSQSELSCSQSGLSGSESELSGGRSELSGGRNELSGGQSERSGSQSELSGSRSERLGSQSERSGSQGGPSVGQSEHSGSHSERSVGQREASASQDYPSAEIDLSWRMRDREASLLADSMRASRLTLLHADPGVARSELLRGGVLPLLRRRASDSVGDEDRESRVVIAFSDRRLRRYGHSSTRLAERVVWFDGWGARPLAALHTAIFESLPEDAITYARSTRLGPMLAELSRRFDAQFLIILDSFERFWDPALTQGDAEQFIDEFSEAVSSDGLRAHFLLSVETLAEPRLDALRHRIDGFDASALHLTRWQSITPPAAAPKRDGACTVAADRPDAASLPVLRDAVPPPPVLTEAAALPFRVPASPKAAAASPLAPVQGRSRTTMPVSPVTATASPPLPAAAGNSRRLRSPRPPFVPPEPIKTEGVYAFIESTLTQTASDFAPWHDADGHGAAPEPDRASLPAAAPPVGPRFGQRPATASAGSAVRSDSQTGPSSGAAASKARLERPGRLDERRNGSVFAWARRLFRLSR